MKAVQGFIKWLFWLMLASVLGGTALIYVLHENKSAAARLPVLGSLPDFQFTSHTGAAFGKASLLGKVSVVDFIFTSCGAACPRMTSEMSELYREFAQIPAVQFVSISTDPENDTLDRLRAFATGYGVTDTRWHFLRGPIAEVAALSEEGFKLSGDFPANHSTKFVLVDQQGQIRGYYDSFDAASLDKLRADIQALLH